MKLKKIVAGVMAAVMMATSVIVSPMTVVAEEATVKDKMIGSMFSGSFELTAPTNEDWSSQWVQVSENDMSMTWAEILADSNIYLRITYVMTETTAANHNNGFQNGGLEAGWYSGDIKVGNNSGSYPLYVDESSVVADTEYDAYAKFSEIATTLALTESSVDQWGQIGFNAQAYMGESPVTLKEVALVYKDVEYDPNAPVWTGNITFDWSNNVLVPASEFGLWRIVNEGDWLRIACAPGTNGQLKFMDKDWAVLTSDELVGDPTYNTNNVDASATYYQGEINAADATTLNSKGLRLSGNDITVTSICVLTPYDINVSTSGIEADLDKAAKGDTVTLTATPDEGYVLDTLTVTGASGEVEVSDDNTFVMPAEEVTVTATFKQSVFEITVAEDIEHGTVTVDKATAAKDATVTVTATPATGYELDKITATAASGAVTVTDNKFTMPESDVTVSATFKAIDYKLTAAEAEGGSIYFEVEGSAAETANVGDAVYVIIEADDYYNLSSATANGVPVEACLFVMPAENVIVTPVFELDIEELKTDVDAALTAAILEATQSSAYTVANLNTAIVNALAEINEAVALTVDTSALTLKASTEETTGAITGTVTIKTGDTTVTTATANVTLNKIPTNPVEIAYEAIVAYLETVTFDNDFHATNQSEAITALVAEKAPGARVNPNFNVIVADYENAGAVKGTIQIIADGYDLKTITVDEVIAVLEKTDEMLLEEAVAATETAIKDIATADGITKDVVTKAIANEDVTVTVKSEETVAPTTTEKGVQTVTITLKLGTLTDTVTKTFDIDMLEVTDEMIVEEAAAAAEDVIKDITSADEITAAAIEKAIANEDVTVTVKSEETKAPTTTEKGVQTVTITLTVGDVTETITKTFDIDMLPAGYQDAANTTIPEGKTVTQKTVVEDGVYSQRFIKKVSAKDLVGAKKIVFTVSNGTKTATYESTKCYSSLNVNGGSLSAGDDYVFLGLTIKDIPENITVTIEDIKIVY